MSRSSSVEVKPIDSMPHSAFSWTAAWRIARLSMPRRHDDLRDHRSGKSGDNCRSPAV